jgi:predicted nucleic acid-binding Zn ribbon protein
VRRERDGKPTAPRRIADALAEVLKAHGLDAEVARAGLLAEWPRLVGSQIAGVTQARIITADGTLVVGVKTHAWMNELSLMERTLVERLNLPGAPARVKRIRWELLR